MNKTHVNCMVSWCKTTEYGRRYWNEISFPVLDIYHVSYNVMSCSLKALMKLQLFIGINLEQVHR